MSWYRHAELCARRTLYRLAAALGGALRADPQVAAQIRTASLEAKSRQHLYAKRHNATF
jgi:hypothetical protein